MEVSSHALAQKRIRGCKFDVAVFTNLTQDHLDYHKDMDDYFAAKALLFSPEYLQGKAIINYDDSYGQKLINSLKSEQIWTYSVNNPQADLYTSQLTYQATGVKGLLHTPLGNIKFSSPLVGQFNLSNLLASVGAVLPLGVNLEIIPQCLPHFNGVPGRMERVTISKNQDINVIVDYAHTPDSLENLLKASRPFISGKMICVFGCGGDRDKTKRPLMGEIASQKADHIIITNDNPRTESAEAIAADIIEGIINGKKVESILDRKQAILTALNNANKDDVILIAGKGHETYQEINGIRNDFSDLQVVNEYFEDLT